MRWDLPRLLLVDLPASPIKQLKVFCQRDTQEPLLARPAATRFHVRTDRVMPLVDLDRTQLCYGAEGTNATIAERPLRHSRSLRHRPGCAAPRADGCSSRQRSGNRCWCPGFSRPLSLPRSVRESPKGYTPTTIESRGTACLGACDPVPQAEDLRHVFFSTSYVASLKGFRWGGSS